MSTVSTNKMMDLPEGSDLAARAPIVTALQVLEDAAAHGVAMQANTSTTAYTTAMPFKSYYDGLRILFLPRYANTAAATININGKGAKKLMNSAGSAQISAAGAIRAMDPIWIEYDSTLDGGAGAFKCYPISTKLTAGDGITITEDAVSRSAEIKASFTNTKSRMTPEGGFAVLMKNRTGAATVHGSAVCISANYDDAFELTNSYADFGVGFVYGSDVANGSDAWVVIAGLAEAILQANNAVTRGGWLDWSTTTPGAVLPWINYTGMQAFKAMAMQSLSSSPTTQLIRVLIQWVPN